MAQSHDKMLHRLQKESFGYFAREYNPSNGLVRDKTEGLSPSSIAVTGFSLAGYIVAVERGFISRSEARPGMRAVHDGHGFLDLGNACRCRIFFRRQCPGAGVARTRRRALSQSGVGLGLQP